LKVVGLAERCGAMGPGTVFTGSLVPMTPERERERERDERQAIDVRNLFRIYSLCPFSRKEFHF
jgi:hypothetical protein